MPVNVAPLITGTSYPAVVDVPATGEFVTQANLTDTAVALGDRIEFVKQAVISLATEIPPFVELTDEFISFGYIAASNLVLAKESWVCLITGASVPQFAKVNVLNPGGVLLKASNNNDKMSLFLGNAATSPVYELDAISLFDAIVEHDDSEGDVSNSTFRVGFSEDANNGDASNVIHGLGFLHEPSTSSNWIVWSKTTGGETRIDTGVPVIADASYTLEGVEDASNDWAMSINGNLVATLSVTTDFVPTTETVNFGAILESDGGAADMIVRRLSVITKNLSPRHS